MRSVACLIKLIRFTGGLAVLKLANKAIRKLASCTHRCQHLVQWGAMPNPEWYDHFLDQYWGWTHIGSGMPWERGVFSSLALKKDGKVLELCCGDGFNAKHFYASKVRSIVAVDFDRAAIEHAKANFNSPKIVYEVCDIRKGLPSGSFNNVIWDAAIEHFTEKEIDFVMLQVKQSLLGDGVLSGYTVKRRCDGNKLHHDHEYEFSSKNDLLRFLGKHFERVMVFETEHAGRVNLYFYASDNAPLPFDSDWDNSISVKAATESEAGETPSEVVADMQCCILG